LCDHCDTQCASSMQTKATGGSWRSRAARPYGPPETTASGEMSKMLVLPDASDATTFWRTDSDWFVCRQAALTNDGSPETCASP